jgi:hypothetical protein
MYKIIKIYPDVMSDPRLRSLEEKLVVCHILGFQNEGKCVFTSDRAIGGLLCLSEHETYELILSLVKRNIVRCTYPNNGTSRFLSIVTPGTIIEDCAQNNSDIFEY